LISACSSSGPGAAPSGLAKGSPARIILVEATGPGPEVEAFIDHFRSEASDMGKLSIVDARLSGASFTSLTSESSEEKRKAFQNAWPGDILLSVSLAQCDPKISRFTYTDTTPEGYRVNRTVASASIACTAALQTFRTDGPAKTENLSVTGTTSYTGSSESGGMDEPMIAASREAGKKAARQLAKKL
jgi:hypothetical protein